LDGSKSLLNSIQVIENVKAISDGCYVIQTGRVIQPDTYIMAAVQAVPISPNKPALPIQQLSLGETFLCGGLAGCAAVTVCECFQNQRAI